MFMIYMNINSSERNSLFFYFVGECDAYGFCICIEGLSHILKTKNLYLSVKMAFCWFVQFWAKWRKVLDLFIVSLWLNSKPWYKVWPLHRRI